MYNLQLIVKSSPDVINNFIKWLILYNLSALRVLKLSWNSENDVVVNSMQC